MTARRRDEPEVAVRAALARLDDAHARTGCVAHREDATVLAAARSAPDGPLHGEPVTVKDWIDVAGFPCTGRDPGAARRPEQDATAVARLRAAGAVVVAKTSVRVEAVRHPRDASRSPGGSSAGEGAAVGSGAVRLGLGSDSGGSIRLPAAWCGVVGLKPSAGLVPLTGHFPRVGSRSDGRTVIGPLAASVDLAWSALTVIAGPDDADGGVAPVRLGDPRAVDVPSLRVALGVPPGVQVTDHVRDGLEQARRALADAGVRPVAPPPDWVEEARRITQAYWDRSDRDGGQVEQDLVDWDLFRQRVLQETRDVDVVVTPTVAYAAPPHRALRTEDYLLCLPASLTGAPAVSVPVGDVGVQVIGKRWRDHVPVAVARVIEQACRTLSSG